MVTLDPGYRNETTCVRRINYCNGCKFNITSTAW